MAATISGTALLQAPMLFALSGAAATTMHQINVVHPNGTTEVLTVTTDATGAASVGVVPQGNGTVSVSVSMTMEVATTTLTVSTPTTATPVQLA